MIPSPVSEKTLLWRFLNGAQEAYCLLLPHPIGQEIQYFFNGVQLIGLVSDDAAELEERSEYWKARLLAEGWLEAEPRLSAVSTPARHHV